MSIPALDYNSVLSQVQTVNALRAFIPNEGGQMRAAKSQAHELIASGGNNSGKSVFGVVKGAWHTVPEIDVDSRYTGKTIHPYMDLRVPDTGVSGWFSSYSSDVQRDTLRPIIDKYLGPYILHKEYADGCYRRIILDGVKQNSEISFKWQSQKKESYAGAKKNWVCMDEPHNKNIYQEIRTRLFKSGGYMWICMTPVIDTDSPVKSADIVWMRDNVVEPWQKNKEKFPLRDIVFIDVEENYANMNEEVVEGFLAGMSIQERAIRKSGLFLLSHGRNAFDTDKLEFILSYLEDHEEESEPEFGYIISDPSEADKFKVHFEPDNSIRDFPEKPQNEWALRVWERAIDGMGLQLCPGYAISVDVAEGKAGGDYTSVTVLRKDNMRMVASIHGHIPEEELAKELWLLGHYYSDGSPDYEPAMIAVEMRNYGGITLRYLLHGHAELGIPKYPYSSIYHRPTPGDMDQGLEFGFAPGWDTNRRTRKFVIMAMREAVLLAFRSIQRKQKCTIPDIAVLREAREFIQNKEGKYEGHPDDRLLSLGIGHAILGNSSFSSLTEIEPPQKDEPDMEARFFMKQDEETGLMQVQFNYDAIVDKIMHPKPNEFQF